MIALCCAAYALVLAVFMIPFRISSAESRREEEELREEKR